MNRILTFILLGLLFESCLTPKDARILKRITKEWRDSKIVLHAWTDTPLSGIFLTLRENGKFEFENSGLVKTFEAGTWRNEGDTITLNYLDHQQTLVKTQRWFIQRKTSYLTLEESKAYPQRLKIMMNSIE